MPLWFSIVLLGLIEGITEFLPISSTGHLLLAEHWLPRQSDLFNTVIQTGAVLAVLVLFKPRLMQLATHWRDPASRDYVYKLAVAFGITGVGGIILKKLHFKLPEETDPVAWATLVGGVLFVLIEWWLKRRKVGDRVDWAVAVAMGLGQLIAAIFPGSSRSGTTILIALALGLSRPAATEFSFLLGVPTLLAAGALQTVSALKDPAQVIDWSMLALGCGVAAVSAFVVVRWLLRYVQTHSFAIFGWYRIVLGAAMLLWARS